MATTEEERANMLREMKICRFCLKDDGELTSIYEKDGKQTVPPLPLQIMACVAIEVFQNDGMPQLICKRCRNLTLQAYAHKTTCKKSDDAIKLFLATGQLLRPLNETTQPQQQQTTKRTLETAVEPKLKQQKTLEAEQQQETAEDENYDLEEKLAEMEGLSEEDKINPVLKVSQVATDVFPCPHCDRSFPLQQLLDLHKAIHERERQFSCDECGRRFFTKYDLGKHSQTHSDTKPFSCVVCGKLFSRESLLHRHEKIHVEVPKYLCTCCDKTFLTREDLDVHSEKHKKKRPYTCKICSKSFVFKQGLERHEISHNHEKPHKCNYCEARFTSPIKLTRHVTSHAGLRPYPCKLCGRTFLLSHHLTRHMRSHYAAKSPSAVPPVGRYKCDVCSMSFRRKDSLINHSAIHSMVNLKCVICNTAFENAKMVKDHITTHLAGLPYPCDKCDYSFESQDQLEEHEMKHAEMEYEEQIEREVTQEAQQEYEDEEDEYNSDEITEFMVTSDPENPEVIRRSKRQQKIKNYAQFLKDELGSDAEDVEEEGEITTNKQQQQTPHDAIKPIIRTEGTKVYTRKPATITSKHRNNPQFLLATASPEQINQPATTLENLGLTKQTVNMLPNKQIVDMKIGNKTVRLQKLMMTKAEIEAMAREGKIEMKGNTILLKKGSLTGAKPTSTKPLTIESIIDEPKSSFGPKPIVKKTYQRRQAVEVEDSGQVEEVEGSDGEVQPEEQTVEEIIDDVGYIEDRN